ncbi:MAG: adenylate/guanylate cyclase domain-containing protein [Saprospiraceae bacterium]|nr:adenylate/guanylate cyclase domain-containing protein [Saprospiraceae bacterium]
MWKFLHIAPAYREEFQAKIRLSNISSMEILAYMAVFFLCMLMYLDYLRYETGAMDQSKVIFYLFLNHLAFAYHLIPLSFIWLHRRRKLVLKASHTDLLINASFVVICITLLIMAVLSYMDRLSLIMYAIFVLVANFMFLVGHRMRILFNVSSLLLVGIVIAFVPEVDYTQQVVFFIEAIGITLPAFFIASFRYNDQIKQFMDEKALQAANQRMEEEQSKNEELLLNILPKNIAEELKLNGAVTPKSYPEVSIMFTDFVDFSRKSESVAPEAIVQKLDFYFSTFDQIMDQFQLEKIKTLGDGYMCIAGIGDQADLACKRMVEAAITIRDFVAAQKVNCEQDDQLCFDIRIGIHVGPVVAGVVGKKKFSFDIWSSNVNIASRMENNSDIGSINISEPVYHRIKDDFECTYRGKIPVKGIGMMAQYFVKNYR